LKENVHKLRIIERKVIVFFRTYGLTPTMTGSDEWGTSSYQAFNNIQTYIDIIKTSQKEIVEGDSKMITKFMLIIVVAIVLILGTSCGSNSPPGEPPVPTNTPKIVLPDDKLENPYQNYSHWYKGHTHTHTLEGPSESGGECRLPVSDVIDVYGQAGYDFLAITDHNTVGTWDSRDIIIINGCESGKTWENHLIALDVSTCPEQCASCVWEGVDGEDYPLCSYGTNQKRIDHVVLGENGLAILAHPSSRAEDCWPGDPIESGWSKDKLKALHGYNAVEIVTGNGNSIDEWEYVLGLGKQVWGVASDDFTCEHHFGRGWIVVNSNSDPIDGQDIIENIRNGNFYSVRHVGGENVPEFNSIQVIGGLVSVSFQRASSVRFIDCTGIRQENEVSRQAELDEEEHSVHYPGDLVGPNGYLRIEIEDSHGNVAYSQPLKVIGASGCSAPAPQAQPEPTCSKTSCIDLECCTGFHCCEGRYCLPNSMECK
jgi:hypothetical protein